MIRSIYYPKNGEALKDISLEKMVEAIQNPEGLLWVSLFDATPEEMLSILRDTFHFHPLAIEDCLSPGYQSPKVDDFDQYVFILMHALKPAKELENLDTVEFNCFLGPNYVVTSHLGPELTSVASLWERLNRDERLTNHGSDFLCHAIFDVIVDEYLPVLDDMDEEIELLEDAVLVSARPAILTRILTLKHMTMTMRRIVSPQREVMNRLSRDEFAQIDPTSRIYFRDIYDHLVRIQELSDSLRDLISDALSTYLSVTSNRMNEIMKALTIVSTIFLPLSFVAGNYGMNFKYMPELNWHLGYPMVIGIYVTIVGGMLTYFKKKKWF